MLRELNVYLDSESFSRKPSTHETAVISNRILNNLETLSISKFAEEVSVKGRTSVLAVFSENKLSKYTDIVSQDLVMLDFDNKDKGNQYLLKDFFSDPFMLNNASFIYTTFTDNVEQDRFRVVFKLSEQLRSNEDVDYMYAYLLTKYPQADITCKNVNRLFYGSTNGFAEISFNNTLNVKTVLDKAEKGFLEFTTNSFINESEIITAKGLPNSSLKVYELLKKGLYEEVSTILNAKFGNELSSVFSDVTNAMNILNTVDMVDLFDLPRKSPFHDIFHADIKPSASIFIGAKTNISLYKVFSESHEFCVDNIGLLQKLTGLSRYSATKLLVDLTGSRIEVTGDVAEIKRNVEFFISNIESTQIQYTSPSFYKVFKNYIPEISQILKVMCEYTRQDPISGEIRVISFLSRDKLSGLVGHRLGKPVSSMKIRRSLDLMVLCEILLKLKDSEIPKDILQLLESSKNNSKNNRRSSVYEIVDWSEDDFITNLNTFCEALKSNGFTIRSLNFEYLYRTFGLDKALKVFPQVYTDVKAEALNDTKYQILPESSYSLEAVAVRFIMAEIESKGFAIEAELREHLQLKMSKDFTDYKLKTIRNDIVKNYNLKRVRFSKPLKELFKNEMVGTPVVYIK